MSVPNIHAKELGTSGLPYLVKATLGGPIGNVFLIDSLIAITVCSLAVHAGGIRMIFTMGRDGRLPFASAIAKVHGKSKTPLVPSIVIGVITILLLVLNVGNQRAFFVLTSVAIIMFYIAYLCVTGPLLIARLRGKWPTPEHGPYFNLGRWGLVVNVLAVIFQIVVMVNLAWPRPGGLRRRPLVLPVGRVHLHRRARRAWASSTTWSSCAAARRRCWPSTAPGPRSRSRDEPA